MAQYDYYDWKPYVPVAARRAQAAREVAKLEEGPEDITGRDRRSQDRQDVLGRGVVPQPRAVQRLREPVAARPDLRAQRLGGRSADRARRRDGDGEWQAAQLAQKPYVGGLGLTSPDNEVTQYWAGLDDTGVDEYQIWETDLSATPSQRAIATRKWAELAYWFQPLSGAAGNQAVRVSGGIRNIDMSTAGGTGGLFTGYMSHRYMTAQFVWDVTVLYDALKRELK